MDNNSLGLLLMVLIIIFLRVIPLLFYVFIIKIIINSIKRTQSRKYFKNNVVIQNNQSTSSKEEKPRTYTDVSKDKLAMFNTDDINTLKKYFYDIFLNFETAYNNLDYNLMKMLSTKQLYQNYYTGITLDLQVGRKRIIDNIKQKQVIIYELDSTIAKQVVSAMIEVSYINYVIDRNGYITSGNRDNPITEKFEVTFRKDFEKESLIKCPNCGATISGNKCEYCRTTIKNEEFKISNIKRIIE